MPKRGQRLNFDQYVADYVSFVAHELNNEVLRTEALLRQAPALRAPAVGETGHPLATIRQLLLQLKRCAAAADRGYACAYSLVDLAHVAEIQRIRLAATPEAERFHLVAPTPVRVIGDPFLLNCAMRNLVDNALNHTDGAVRVSVRSDPGSGTAHVWVEDEGCGFISAPRLAQATHRGWGLGHPIVATIARLHAAELQVRSEPAHGVGLIFRAPALPPAAAFAQSSATVTVAHR